MSVRCVINDKEKFGGLFFRYRKANGVLELKYLKALTKEVCTSNEVMTSFYSLHRDATIRHGLTLLKVGTVSHLNMQQAANLAEDVSPNPTMPSSNLLF
jgi:hypothetical protein